MSIIKRMIIKNESEPKMNFDIELRNLNLLTGLNGVGKSFILKLNFALTSFLASVHGISQSPLVSHPRAYEEAMQYLLDGTYEDQRFTGEFTAEGDNARVKVILEDGQVMKVDHFVAPGTNVGAPLFMSTTARTFQQIRAYLKFRKLMGVTDVSKPDQMPKMLEGYRLYDILYIEKLLVFIKNITPAQLMVIENQLKAFDQEFNISQLTVTADESDILYTDDKVSDQSLTRLGNGHQALINMTIGSNMTS